MKRLLFLPALAPALGMGVLAQTYYGNGYTIVEPEAVDDRLSGLDAMVFKTVDAYSVQEGLEQLLQGSGWALAGADNADPQIWRLYRQPWPDNKRTLNPMPLARALEWVAGDGWALVVDPVNRLVSFEVNARYAARPTPAAATVANAPADAALPPATGYTRVSPTNPYTATVSYADSPSHAASFDDSSYTASANAVMVSPPDYHDGYNPPPRQPARDAKPLRPAATHLADLKTVSAGAGTGKAPSASGKNRRKTAATPVLLPVEKTTARTTSRTQQSAGAATATNSTATTATDKKAAAATSKKTAAQAATAPKSTATPATDTANKPAADNTAKTAAASGKTVAPATEPAKKAATAQQTATTPATEGTAASPAATGTKGDTPALLHKKPSATPAQTATATTTSTTDSTSGEARP